MNSNVCRWRLDATALRGIITATVTPFDSKFEVDYDAIRAHVKNVIENGSTGITCNAMAGEVASLTREEKKRIVQVIVDTVRKEVPVIAGVFAESTREAIEAASDAKATRADALLVGAPSVFGRGIAQAEGIALKFFEAITSEVEIPIVVYQHPH